MTDGLTNEATLDGTFWQEHCILLSCEARPINMERKLLLGEKPEPSR